MFDTLKRLLAGEGRVKAPRMTNAQYAATLPPQPGLYTHEGAPELPIKKPHLANQQVTVTPRQELRPDPASF